MIYLIDDFYLDADDLQFILVEWNGKTKFSKLMNRDVPANPKLRFYPDLTVLLQKLTMILERRAIVGSTGMEQLVCKFEEIKQMINIIGEDLTKDFGVVKQGR